MKILIVEDELYLAQSIANKLSDKGHECEFAATTKEALKEGDYDVVLLSTNISGQNFIPVIHKHKHTIVILMVSYINNDTVSVPLKEGAKDYILKPFMIEELIRKINHFKEYEQLKKEYETLKSYTSLTFARTQNADGIIKDKLPVVIKTSQQLNADAAAFSYATSKKLPLQAIDLKDPAAKATMIAHTGKSILYCIGFENLKKNEKEDMVALSNDKLIIFSSLNAQESTTIPLIEIASQTPTFDYSEILDIESYIKMIITNHQENYPDTELSKKLGISRKSLWEKRKKYDIFKRK